MNKPSKGLVEIAERMADVSLPEPAHETLTGELAEAYREFCDAARDLEGKAKAADAAKQRAQVALARFTRLATGGSGPAVG